MKIDNLIKADSIVYFNEKENLGIDLVLTSPSYYKDVPSKSSQKNEIGVGESKDEYIKLLSKVFSGIYKNMNRNGICVLVIGLYKNVPMKNIIYSLEDSFLKIGFHLLKFKEFNPYNSESILIFSKNSLNMKIDIPNFDSLQEYKSTGFGTLSSKVLEWAISNFSKVDDLVVDPFAGRGSTLYKANEMNRKYLGVDIN